MKYILYADLHLYSPIEMLRKEVSYQPPAPNVKLLGDIVDESNAAYSDVKNAETLHWLLKGTHGTNYIDGNHERESLYDQIIVENGIVFAHGDMQANPSKWLQYRAKPHGAGFFKRKFIIPFIREAEEIINRKPKPEFLERAYKLAKIHGCHTYVGAHFHPKELIDISYKDIRIVIVPRGKTEIEL